MDAGTGRRQKRLSQKQEKKTAADLGGRTQAASGAAFGGGGDVRAPGTRVECKYTESGTYALKLLELTKLETQAMRALEEPVFQVQFRAGTHVYSTWAIVRVKGYVPSVLSFVGKKQVTLERGWLEAVAIKNPGERVDVQFTGSAVDPLFYEIIPWDVYLKRRKEANA